MKTAHTATSRGHGTGATGVTSPAWWIALAAAFISPPPSLHACTATSFSASGDFSSTQGTCGWGYRYWPDGAANTSAMSWVASNSWWKGNETYLLLWSDGGHPGASGQAIRRWTAPTAGTVRVTGKAWDAHDCRSQNIGADGVSVLIVIPVPGTTVWSATIAEGNTTGISFDQTVTVSAGTILDFRIKRGPSNNYCDSTGFNPTITYQTTTTYPLTVTKAGTGSGTVTSAPAGISCGSTCSASFTSGTSVTLSASPASGSSFTSWSGACSGTGSCTVAMTAKRDVTATFTPTGTFCVGCLSFRVGTPKRITGPHSNAEEMADGPLTAFAAGGVVRGFSSEGCSNLMEGASVPLLVPKTLGCANAALKRGADGSFDDGGSWITTVEPDGGLMRAWYHAEDHYPSHQDIQKVWMSAAYAESTDGGVTFTKSNYPNNIVVSTGSPSDPPTLGNNLGVSGPTVVKWNGYYYMYYGDMNNGAALSVARAPVSSGGKRTSTSNPWLKYANGSFNSPGLGGAQTSLGFSPHSNMGASVYTPANRTVIVWPIWNSVIPQLRLSFSDATLGTTFTHLAEPLLLTDIGALTNPSTFAETVVYPSIVVSGGGTNWSSGFELSYVYLQPGEDFEKRYLVTRHVDVTVAASPIASPNAQVKVALSRYYAPSRVDHWVTTQMVPTTGYTWEGVLGYVGTLSRSGMVELTDCYQAASDDHYVSLTGCGSDTKLRRLGYLWSTSQPGTHALYRCYWDTGSGLNHFVSSSSTCDGLKSDGLLGYAYD